MPEVAKTHGFTARNGPSPSWSGIFREIKSGDYLVGREDAPGFHTGPRAAAATAPTFATPNRPQPAANDLDILQSELAKFDLRSENADIAQRGGRNHKAADGITKTADGELDPIHFNIPCNTNAIKSLQTALTT